MTVLKTFMINNAVQSKIAGDTVVRFWNGNPIIFIHGYPMTYRGFTMLASKAILGDDIKMHPAWWEEVHLETAMLCEMLPVSPAKGREAFEVLQGIRTHLQACKINETEQYTAWMADVENKVEEARKGE
jgi:hypothetical protein